MYMNNKHLNGVRVKIVYYLEIYNCIVKKCPQCLIHYQVTPIYLPIKL